MYLPSNTPLPPNSAAINPATAARYTRGMVKWALAFDSNRQNCAAIDAVSSLPSTAWGVPWPAGFIGSDPNRNLMSATGVLGSGVSPQSMATAAAAQTAPAAVSASSSVAVPSTAVVPASTATAALSQVLTPSQMAEVSAAPAVIQAYDTPSCAVPTGRKQQSSAVDYSAPAWGNSALYPPLPPLQSVGTRNLWVMGLVAAALVAVLSLSDNKKGRR